MKTIITILALFIYSFISTHAQAIHSTTDGGMWADTSTWVGRTVPTGADNVVINGPVYIMGNSNECNNITINPGKWLGALQYYYAQLTIFGDIVNNGSIGGDANFNIFGNINNNGNWASANFSITLKGANQTIACAANSSIHSKLTAVDSTTNLFLGSNLHLIVTSDYVCNFSNAEIFTQGYNLRMDGGQLINARVTTNDTITINGTILSYVTIDGNYFLNGFIYAYAFNVFKGTVNNLGTIKNFPGLSTFLTIDGIINNYGLMQQYEIRLKHKANNYGTWEPFITRFTGTNEKTIINSPGHPFGGTNIIIADSGTVVKLGSDVEISANNFVLGNGKLDCNNFILSANTKFQNGTILNASQINQNGSYEYVTIEGSTILSGKNKMMFSALNGAFTNLDTITTAYLFSGNALKINGHFINKGEYYNLTMDLFGNLTNHDNIYDNSSIYVKGTSNQSINISSPINSQVTFFAMISGTTYQWLKNGIDINGAQNDHLLFNTLEPSDEGVYKCRVIVNGNTIYSREISVNLVTEVENKIKLSVSDFILSQNYPNPFNPSTVISYQLPVTGDVTLRIYDVLGREVATLVNEEKPSGIYEIEFYSTGLASGVYYYQLRAGDYTETKKMILLR